MVYQDWNAILSEISWSRRPRFGSCFSIKMYQWNPGPDGFHSQIQEFTLEFGGVVGNLLEFGGLTANDLEFLNLNFLKVAWFTL